jgi:hypothetical protein
MQGEVKMDREGFRCWNSMAVEDKQRPSTSVLIVDVPSTGMQLFGSRILIRILSKERYYSPQLALSSRKTGKPKRLFKEW